MWKNTLWYKGQLAPCNPSIQMYNMYFFSPDKAPTQHPPVLDFFWYLPLLSLCLFFYFIDFLENDIVFRPSFHLRFSGNVWKMKAWSSLRTLWLLYQRLESWLFGGSKAIEFFFCFIVIILLSIICQLWEAVYVGQLITFRGPWRKTKLL